MTMQNNCIYLSIYLLPPLNRFVNLHLLWLLCIHVFAVAYPPLQCHCSLCRFRSAHSTFQCFLVVCEREIQRYVYNKLTWLKVASNSAIDRSTAIILYLLSFRGTAIKETWASTMSPTRKNWGFKVSTLFIFVSIVIRPWVRVFRTFWCPLKCSRLPDNSKLGFLRRARILLFSGLQGCREDLLMVKRVQIPCLVHPISMWNICLMLQICCPVLSKLLSVPRVQAMPRVRFDQTFHIFPARWLLPCWT